jgi:hypothetical protein
MPMGVENANTESTNAFECNEGVKTSWSNTIVSVSPFEMPAPPPVLLAENDEMLGAMATPKEPQDNTTEPDAAGELRSAVFKFPLGLMVKVNTLNVVSIRSAAPVISVTVITSEVKLRQAPT